MKSSISRLLGPIRHFKRLRKGRDLGCTKVMGGFLLPDEVGPVNIDYLHLCMLLICLCSCLAGLTRVLEGV